MKNLVILGAGTAGTMVANHMRGKLPSDWRMTVIDPETHHVYQPGLLFVPFGKLPPERLTRPRARTLRSGVEWVQRPVERVDSDARRVVYEGGESQAYDLLVLATGSRIRPEETEGLMDDGWRRNVHEFYTVEGATALRDTLRGFDGGRLVLNVVEMPIKCPVAPLEFLFLADEYFTRRGIRERVELVYATPLDGAFTKKVCNSALSYLLEAKGIKIETEFNAGEVDAEAGSLRSWDEREIPFDLLVSIPTHSGALVIEDSGLGNELAFVPTEHRSLKAREHDDIFVLGDATDLPASKAGSVAHFQSEVLAHNLQRVMAGRSLDQEFDGHANCFIESGHGKALLIDFNYELEPVPGEYPLPTLGPFSLLKETRINHLGKLAFEWIYWHALLPARSLPVSAQMSMLGKRVPEGVLAPDTE